ncbi:C2H2 type zinc-finger-domain-containing protein [Colletotrichum godetiae]|uniref:C2H2 type zinc-finger-domain-containing protein n=1 Tax=Colletotrichum godetiae TaxID=1209918 RepID=A0AAJ0EM12_9PEZI|nr:C2H2 type zinc-finger-domain-containing protein [Colletotrichum godetiae]KAK1658170.1 C2H2 type zinc-finger-domain-containing protein [Colletotrichum godetiae]
MEQPSISHFKLSATSCGTCAVHFDNPDTRRAHSKSQWHVTNLKRRMADLEPLTAEQHAASVSTQPAAAPGKDESTPASDSPSSSASEADLSDAEDDDDDDFIPEECLFCTTTSDSLDDNIAHMHKAHGMFIPDKEKLIVDVETLVKYLHLVIFRYRECLQCGTQRRTAAAVQQHMLGKGHCRFDVTAEDSEFRDFYKQPSEDVKNTREEGDARKAVADALEEGGSIRLPSGKQLSHRSAPGPSRPRTKIGANNDTATSDNLIQERSGSSGINESEASFQLTTPSGPGGKFDTKVLTRAEKRDVVFETQLSRLSINDRSALAHLSSAEQRSVLLTRQKQLDKAEKAARRLQTRLEMKANKTGQGNFVNDVPGRKNG